MTKYYLHIGFHKTGYKIFQHRFFPNLPKSAYIYNPPKLTQLIADLIKAEKEDEKLVLDAISKEKNLENISDKKIIISREIMSGDLFTFYKGYESHYQKLYNAFPQAKIICFLRYQCDWIVSCYRETIHEHHYQHLKQFLSLKDSNDKYVKANYKDLDFPGIISCLNKLFGKENIKYSFEDFIKDKNSIVKRISKFIGTERLPPVNQSSQIPNRGYSAFSIKLSIFRSKFLKMIGLNELLVHRPIFFWS